MNAIARRLNPKQSPPALSLVQEASPAPADKESAAVPSLRSVSPELTEAIGRLEAVERLIADLNAEREELTAAGIDNPAAGVSPRVAELLGHALSTAPVSPADVRLRQLDTDIAALMAERRAIEAEVRNLRRVAARIVCNLVEPNHADLVRELAAAAAVLHQVNCRYTRFANEMNRRGVQWARLSPAHPVFLGAPDAKNGPLGEFFRQLVRDGHIGKHDIPKELR